MDPVTGSIIIIALFHSNYRVFQQPELGWRQTVYQNWPALWAWDDGIVYLFIGDCPTAAVGAFDVPNLMVHFGLPTCSLQPKKFFPTTTTIGFLTYIRTVDRVKALLESAVDVLLW